MFYYQIIPLVKTSLEKPPFFTYAFNEFLPEGTLVEIDFARKHLKGVVYESTRKPKFFTKPISLVIEKALLTSEQLKFAQQISERYLTSLGVVLKFFIPPITRRVNLSENTDRIKTLTRNNKSSNIILTANQKKAADNIVNFQATRFLLFGPAASGKTEVIMQVIDRMLRQKRQSLILIPDIFLAYQEIERYRNRFADKLNHSSAIVFIHSGLKPSQLFNAWQAIKNNTAKIIISTRVGIFFPFNKLGLIVLDEEQDASYKQWDQSPRYHVRDLAPGLAESFKAKIVYVSATLSLESYYQSKQDEIKMLSLPQLKTKDISVQPPKIKIVNLAQYYFKQKNKPIIISTELQQALAETLNKKKQAFILVSRQGKSKLVVCHDCKKVLKCRSCEVPLVHSGDEYRCLHCNYKTSLFAKCPSCGSFRLKNIGFGTEKAAEQIKSLFPSAQIEIADSKFFQKEAYRAELYRKLSTGEIDILIGSPTITKGFDLPSVSLVAVLHAQQWAGQADFRFDERWLGTFFQIAGRLNRPGSRQDGVAVIQTFHPENALYKFLLDWNWLGYLEYELSNRQALGYPPFAILVRLIYRNLSLKRVEKSTNLVYNKLMKVKSPQLSILPPYYGAIRKQRRKWEKNILIKAKSLENSELRKLLSQLAKDWIVDIQPENIF